MINSSQLFLLVTLTLGLLVSSASSFLLPFMTKSNRNIVNLASTLDGIEYQSDESKYGRGEMHLSAVLDTGDIVVYQTGTWYVDGVEVGTGEPPSYSYALVETIQLVWTHNCEHGVIRALPLKSENDGKELQLLDEECIEFGPEQLIAKLPLEWNEELQKAESPMLLEDSLWENALE